MSGQTDRFDSDLRTAEDTRTNMDWWFQIIVTNTNISLERLTDSQTGEADRQVAEI